MPQPFTSPLKVGYADAAQIAATTTESSLIPDVPFGADDERIYPGAQLNIRAWFDISNVVTTPGTVRFRLRWGTGGVVLADSGAIPMDTTARSNFSGMVEVDLSVRSVGSAGKMFAQGLVKLGNVPAGAAGDPQGDIFMGNAGEQVPGEATVDTTADKMLQLTAEFSVNTAGTQIRAHIWRVLHINS